MAKDVLDCGLQHLSEQFYTKISVKHSNHKILTDILYYYIKISSDCLSICVQSQLWLINFLLGHLLVVNTQWYQ